MTQQDNPFEEPHHEIDDLVRDPMWVEVPAPADGYWGRINDRLAQVGPDQNSNQQNIGDEVSVAAGDTVTDISPASEPQEGETEPSRRRKFALWPVAVAAAVIVLALMFGSNGFGLRNNEIQTGFADDDGIEETVTDEGIGVADAVPDDGLGPVMNRDHWYAVYGVWDCTAAGGEGDWVPPFQSTRDDSGIHSHGDGLIHIHPFFEWSAGENAQLGLFANEMGITLTDFTLELDTGQVLIEGEDCGGEPAVLHIRRWQFDFEALGLVDVPPTIVTTDLASERFYNDREVWTIAFAPLDAELPLPPQIRFDTLNTVTAPFDLTDVDRPDPDGPFVFGNPEDPTGAISGPRPTATEFFTILPQSDVAPLADEERLGEQVEVFTLLPELPSARVLGLLRYPQQVADGANQICVRLPGDVIGPVCGDGSATEGTKDTNRSLSYVVYPDTPDAAAWMVVELDDGSSIAVNVARELAYVEWSTTRGSAIRTVILDADLTEIEVRE